MPPHSLLTRALSEQQHNRWVSLLDHVCSLFIKIIIIIISLYSLFFLTSLSPIRVGVLCCFALFV